MKKKLVFMLVLIIRAIMMKVSIFRIFLLFRLFVGFGIFFSVEHHLSHISLGAISTEQLHYSVYTNSDHLTINLLMNTDVCSLGINFLHDRYRQYDIQQLRINNCEPFLLIGYICPENGKISEASSWFIQHFQAIL